jgi:hypothetical protein
VESLDRGSYVPFPRLSEYLAVHGVDVVDQAQAATAGREEAMQVAGDGVDPPPEPERLNRLAQTVAAR